MPIQIQHNISLRDYNTFHIEASARFFVEVHSMEELKEVILEPSLKGLPKLVLGGGSNLLFSGDYKGLVIKNAVKGIEVVKEDGNFVWVKANGGEVWHDLVKYAIAHNLAGIENLSLIPGLVGATPMQNIGAYGVELVSVFEELEAVDMETAEVRIFNKEECHFGYRESVFKRELKGRYFIFSVTLRLNKTPKFNVSYGDIKQTLNDKGIYDLSIKAVSDAVISIRQSKLPDPAQIGNAGSFFKNPEIPKEQFDELVLKYPVMPSYPAPNGKIKVPAGWLIEQCGWKGKRVGNAGVHARQALVLVNYGNATGKEIMDLAANIIASVKEKFGIELTPEVNLI